MKHLSPMINSAIEEDKEGFIDSFVKEFVDRVNEKVSLIHNGIRKNALQPEGVWNVPEAVEEPIAEKNGILSSKWDEIKQQVNEYRFQSVDEAKKTKSKLVSSGMCESCVKQIGNRLYLESVDNEDIIPEIYDTLIEDVEDLYIPFFEFGTDLKEALETGSVDIVLDDGTEINIESEMAETIARVHDSLTRENQISFRDEITLNEESFDRMINFVNKAMKKLDEGEEIK
tara:strand:- start:843 stop:1529 length:687 start_codon:yes stop_codon:yes gene_type:complete